MRSIRTLILTLLSWLLPLIVVIIGLFLLLSLFYTGLTPLWQTGLLVLYYVSSGNINYLD
ncbi:MAG TPA: hypothetical protein VHZ76_04990 [Gammaproteobacteria bacterium]|nr:hypothetical protein [Gammaproteobacteria bacterium]